MIAADTCSIIAFLDGDEGQDVEVLRTALHNETLAIPPAVLMEALSDPYAKGNIEKVLEELPMLDTHEGFWRRAAKIRRDILSRGFKSKLGDALVAQCCIDNNVMLITRDKDFRHYATYCGLKLYA